MNVHTARQSVLIVGYGSIGRRHCENLWKLGVQDVHILRSNRRSKTKLPSPSNATVHTDWAAASENRYDFAIVANPTSLHSQTASMLVAAGIPVILEKPVDACLDAAFRLMLLCEKCSIPISMGYCFRYHPLYMRVRREIDEGSLGEISHVRLWQASYLPDWHPWENYRESYAAQARLGGGVIRTLDHELDMLRWLLGDPVSVICVAARTPSLGADVEDTADMIFRYGSGCFASVHVSFACRGYSRGLCVVGEKATCRLDWARGTVTTDNGNATRELARLPADFELNSCYVTMLREAISGFTQAQPGEAIPLRDGIEALRMAEASLRSNRLRREVPIDEVQA